MIFSNLMITAKKKLKIVCEFRGGEITPNKEYFRQVIRPLFRELISKPQCLKSSMHFG